MGLDDVRPFNFKQGGVIPIYGSVETIDNIRHCFRYIFDSRFSESSVPRLVTTFFDCAPIDFFGLEFTPIRFVARQRHCLRFPLRVGRVS